MSTRLIKITALVAAIFPITGAFAFAQEPAAPAVAKPEAAAKAVEEPKAVVTKGKDTLSVDFPDEEIRNVLRNVADLFELNLVIPNIRGSKQYKQMTSLLWFEEAPVTAAWRTGLSDIRKSFLNRTMIRLL